MRQTIARLVAGGICGVVLIASPLVAAQQSSSPNYQVNEVTFGGGAALNVCSANYCAKQSAAEIAAGNTAGAAFQAQAGFNTGREPYLAFSVAGGDSDLGTLSTFGAATTTATFAVKTYLASGYVVQVVSDPPTSNGIGHQLNPLASPTASAPGSEQFGINLTSNTAPATFGANPVQVPDNTFSFGSVAAGYNTPNLFKYAKGDTIASSSKSTGQTNYTISFLYNISNVTPEGLYRYSGTLVATATF